MSKILVGAVGILLSAALFGCGPGPGDTPEETARILAENYVNSRLQVEIDQEVEDMRFQIECYEKDMEWRADRGESLKVIDVVKARLEFYEDNLDKLKDEIEYNITEVRVDKDDDKKAEVEVKIWRYVVKQDDDNYKDLDLIYTDRTKNWSLINDDGWKIRNKKKSD